MIRTRLLAAAVTAVTFAPAALVASGSALAQQAQPPQPAAGQKAPMATEPFPTPAPGQAPMNAAVTGSAPAPDTTSKIDKSQEQQGKLLKPGAGAGDMGAASGATSKAGQPSP